ncbi:MAG: hypothetical protein ABIF19_11950 [Planctomycetota bacterium]
MAFNAVSLRISMVKALFAQKRSVKTSPKDNLCRYAPRNRVLLPSKLNPISKAVSIRWQAGLGYEMASKDDDNLNYDKLFDLPDRALFFMSAQKPRAKLS